MTFQVRINTKRPESGSEQVASLPPRYMSNDLLGTHRHIVIEHRGEAYYLRHTRNGKLILTK